MLRRATRVLAVMACLTIGVSCSKSSGTADGKATEAVTANTCGDGKCTGSETCATCPKDCGPCNRSGDLALIAELVKKNGGDGEACVKCVQKMCFEAEHSGSCDGSPALADAGHFAPTDLASTGPAVGTPKNKLCYDLLTCLLTKRAGEYCGSKAGVAYCYLGTGDPLGNDQNGVCKAEEQRALESTAPIQIAKTFTDLDLGGGVANGIVACLLAERSCRKACGM